MSVVIKRIFAFLASALLVATVFVAPAATAIAQSGGQTAHLTWQGDPTVSQNGLPIGTIMFGNGSNFVATTYEFVCVKRISGTGTVQYMASVGFSPRFGPLQEFTPTTAGTAADAWLGVGLDKPYTGAPFVYFEQFDGVHAATSKGQVIKVDVYGYGPNSGWVSNPCA